MALRTVGVKLTAEVAGYMAGIRQAGRATKEFAGDLDRAAKADKLDHVANSAGAMGLALGAGFGLAVKAGMDFDKQMSAVSAATHATTGDMERLRKAALQAGKDTSFSATEAAQGIEELSKAGVSTAQILSGGLSGALDLAAAGGLDVAESAEIAASAMTQFKLEGSAVPHIADLLAAAAGKAQGSVHDMGMALSQSGLVASQMGLTIEDTTGTLAAFASAGLIGSDAGTSFKTMLLALANPAEKTRDLMKDLGINAYDAAGNFVGVTNLAEQLREKLGGLTQAQRDAALAQIFGSDAIRAANVLYQEGAQGIQEWIDKTNDQGYAAETAAARTDNLAGDIERLTGSLETLAIESSTSSASGLRTLVQAADNLVGSLSSIPAPAQNAAVLVAGVTGAALLAAAAAGKMRAATGRAGEQLESLGPRGVKAAEGLDKASKGAARAGLALAALQAAAAIGGDSVNAQVDGIVHNLEKFAVSGEAAGEVARVFGGDMDKLDQALHDIASTDAFSSFMRGAGSMVEGITGIGNAYDLSLQHSRERLEALDQALAQMVKSGRGEQAAAAFKKVADRAAEQGVSVDELRKVLPGYATALETASSSAESATGATAGATKAMGGFADKTDEAKEQVEELNDAFDALFDQQMSLDEALINSADSVADLTESFKENKRNTDINTEAGRANRRAILDRIESIKAERDARFRQGQSLDEVNKKYVKDIDGLRATMRQAGFTDKQIDELTGSYRAVPAKVNTNVTVTGDAAARAKLALLSDSQQALKMGITVQSYRAQKYAVGGMVYGPGGPTGDQIPALLSNREFVQPAKAVDFYGVAAMEAIRTKKIPAEDLRALAQFADGGLVHWPFPVNASKTRIPSWAEVMRAVIPAAPPAGAQTLDFMVRVLRQAFPGLGLISGYRPGARTLSGALSYHALKRAVDYPPSWDMAAWVNRNYKSRTKEFISPYQDMNILNGRRHTYTGAVWMQHNFAGGNAHDHWAMASGGMIREPVFGIGRSGNTYSFGENYRPERVTPMWETGGGGATVVRNVYLAVNVAPGANLAEAGRQMTEALDVWAKRNGFVWRSRS